jgi:hypothetical protein
LAQRNTIVTKDLEETPLAGKRILLLGIGFYDYDVAIANEMRRLGAEVEVLSEQPSILRSRIAPIIRQLPRWLKLAQIRYKEYILHRIRAMGRIDQVLIIKCETLDEQFIATLRDVAPTAWITAFQWDSMRRYPNLLPRQKMFDKVFTFDHIDALLHSQFSLRPNFFRRELTDLTAASQDIDLCFVGWLHHDRLNLLDSLREQANEQKLTRFFHLYTGRWTAMKLNATKRGTDVSTRQLSFADYAWAAARSRVLIDLPHPNQSGLSMRAIDALGLGRKLITTAQDIKHYNFYRPENIAIIDLKNPVIDPAFLTTPMIDVPPEIIASYGFAAWAKDITGVTEPSEFVHRDLRRQAKR